MKKSEARLLGIFAILILGAITFFVLDVLKDKKNEALARQVAVQKEIDKFNELIEEKEKWEYLRGFVDQYQPRYRSEVEEAPALEAYFRNHAVATGIEVTTLLPRAPEELGDNMVSLSIEAKVSGAGGDILSFLTRLQGENKFYAIPSITIAADRKDPSLVKADMIFSRWFTLDGELPTAEPPVADPVAGTPAAVAKKNEDTPAEAEPN